MVCVWDRAVGGGCVCVGGGGENMPGGKRESGSNSSDSLFSLSLQLD